MAASRQEIQVTWSAANTKTLNTNNWVVSDEITLNVDDWNAFINVRGDNQGTPASGDEVELRLLPTTGDVDNGAGADDYPDVNTAGSTGSGVLLGVIDTYNRYDPDWVSRRIETAPKKCKLAARAKQGATRNIVIAARIATIRGAIA